MSWVRQMFSNGASPGTPREQLIRRLGNDGTLSPDAVRAIASVPREKFVPPQHAGLAYEDAALEIGPAATISAPSMVAAMLSVLELQPGMKVLEIGAGSGYAAAASAVLGASVVGIELQPELAEQGRRNLEAAGVADRVVMIAADGTRGWPDAAPYDRILVSAAVEAVPQEWLQQLAQGGMLVYPEAGEGIDLLVRLTKTSDGFHRQEMGHCRFVRLQVEGGYSSAM
ncbi:MAG: protein-L-isoaspartate(D-aspartate) O-methyltransferase [Candidatus Dormiibacterota bacterium]